MPTWSDRIWSYLPNFLKGTGRTIPNSSELPVNSAICEAFGAGIAAQASDVALLRARGLGTRFSGLFSTYYASDGRPADMIRLGRSRLTGPTSADDHTSFESYLSHFGDPARDQGTKGGIQAELERTGVTVDSIVELYDDHDRWLILSYADAEDEGDPIELSVMYDYDDYAGKPSGQRSTVIYAWGDEIFSFRVDLSGSGPGIDEVKQILRRAKPAWTRGWVKMPAAPYYSRVD